MAKILSTVMILLLITTLHFTVNVQRAKSDGTIPGDVDGNGRVDIFDMILLASSFMATPNGPKWNPKADMKGDDVIDIYDAMILSNHFGEDANAYSSPAIYADGTTLRMSDTGQAITFKGTQVDYNVLGGGHDSDKPEWLVQDYWFNQSDVKKLKSYGCNLIEFHRIGWKDLMPEKGVLDLDWFAKSDRWISWIEQEGMYCIVGLSNFEYTEWGIDTPTWMLEKYPQPWTEDVVERANLDFWDTDNPLQEEARQAFVETWKNIAARYLNNPNVMFGLVNEPFCGNSLINGQNAKHFCDSYVRLIERVIDGIRSVGSKQIVFVDKPYCWFATDYRQGVDRDNVVWEDHLYVTPPDIQWAMNISQWKKTLNEYAYLYVDVFGKPFYLGEYSFYPHEVAHDGRMPNWRANLTDQVDFLKTLPLCAYAWHEYPSLHDEWYDWYNSNYKNKDCFTEEESDFILRTIFS